MTNRIPNIRRNATQALVAAVLALTVPAALTAQSAPADPRWQGWIGCWRPAPAMPDDPAASLGIPIPDANGPLLCIVPADGASSVEMVTVADGKVVARETIDASGTEWSRTRGGCAGVESARWSGDARRVYLKSRFTCPGDLERTSNGLLAISTEGQLLDVQGVVSGSGKSVRVARYRDAGAPASLPTEIARAIDGRAMAVGASRTAAGAPITETEIVEASRNLEAPVVQAWLIESGQHFSVDAKTLLRLAKAGVPGGVTDVMVALSYPKVFAVSRATFEGDLRTLHPDSAALAGSGRTIYADVFPPNVGGYYNGYRNACYYGYSPFGYSAFGLSPFGYSPTGYSPCGYSSLGSMGFGGYGYTYGGGVPIIIVRTGAEQRHGKVVNGRGYTRNDPPSTSGASTSSDRQPASSSGSSGTRSSGSSGSSSSGGERQAKPRP